jgi:GDP-4-dehydro-6-deoxy-D-mannose reductase
MRSLVTGATGFVGAYLVRELVAAGHEVIATDVAATAGACAGRRRGTGVRAGAEEPLFPKDTVYRRCDVLDTRAVADLVSSIRPDCIFHLAAQSSAGRSHESPRATLETNVFGTLNVLEAVRRLSPPCPPAKTVSGTVRVLSVGSSEEYGARSREEMPLGEGSPIEPASPYAVSKAAQTMLALQYARSYAVDAVATRSFSHTGPRQSAWFALPSFARQCAEVKAGRRARVVRVGRLDVVRDFLDVRDVVRAYRILAEGGASGTVYNVCSGEGLSLRDALAFLIRRSGVDIAVEEDPALLRPSDIPILVGNNGRLRRECGWEREIPTDVMLGDLFDYWERVAKES